MSNNQQEVIIGKLTDKLGQLYPFYENATGGALEISHAIRLLIDYHRPNRQAELLKLVDTLIDMRRYASESEAIRFTEAIELLSEYNRNVYP